MLVSHVLVHIARGACSLKRPAHTTRVCCALHASTRTSKCSSTCVCKHECPSMSAMLSCQVFHPLARRHAHTKCVHTFRTSTRSGRCQTFVLIVLVWPSCHSMWRALKFKISARTCARSFLDRPVHPLPMAQARGSLTHARPSNSAAAARYVDEKEPVC
jgi:hypothetical protein